MRTANQRRNRRRKASAARDRANRGEESKSEFNRRLMLQVRDEWAPLQRLTLPAWRWLTQICAVVDFERRARR